MLNFSSQHQQTSFHLDNFHKQLVDFLKSQPLVSGLKQIISRTLHLNANLYLIDRSLYAHVAAQSQVHDIDDPE